MIFALILCAAGQLPAGCPTLPAGHSGSVAGPWCCRSRSAPRSRPRGAADVLRSPPVADVLPVVLPARQLPAGCPTLPAGHSGSVAGPWCCPVKIGPTLPAPWCCRRAARPVNSSMCCAPGACPARFRRYRFTFSILSFWIPCYCRRANRYNPTHFHTCYALFCCFRALQAAICP